MANSKHINDRIKSLVVGGVVSIKNNSLGTYLIFYMHPYLSQYYYSEDLYWMVIVLIQLLKRRGRNRTKPIRRVRCLSSEDYE